MSTSIAHGPGDGASRSFREWSQAGSLAEALSRAEAAVRAKPQEARARWLLFELLRVLGHWERALRQLQTWAGLSREHESTAHVMRGLIRAEHRRMQVLSGRAEPATLTASGSQPPAWMAGLAEALRLGAAGDAAAVEAADAAREAALEEAQDAAGECDQVPFAWISDSDSRLGPVCELILAGAYRWVAFSELDSITQDRPQHLLDLVWAQMELVLRDGTALNAYMPMRYPLRAGERDALLLARETVWNDVGRTGVIGRGQKMWISDARDLALLDLRSCRFAHAPSQAAGAGNGGPGHAAG